MGSINPAKGPIPKPEPKKKGGLSPQRAGKRYEREFAKKHGGERVIGSGAFGFVDPTLKGDIRITIGDKDYLLETKSLHTLNTRGEKIVTFELRWLEKITKEAMSQGKIPGLIIHPKGASQEYLFVRFDWFKELIGDYMRQINELSDDLIMHHPHD